MYVLFCFRCFLISKEADGGYADQLIEDHEHSRQNEQYDYHTDDGTTCKQCTDRTDHLNL